MATMTSKQIKAKLTQKETALKKRVEEVSTMKSEIATLKTQLKEATISERAR